MAMWSARDKLQAEKHRRRMRASSPCHKLSPDGWASRTLHFLAESGDVSHSFIRLCSPDCLGSARIPSVLIFLMKYCASVTEASSMWVTLCTVIASGAEAVMSKRQTLCFALLGGSILKLIKLSTDQ